MSRVRVLVGTRKGAFILTSDGKRKNWEVKGPFFGGWEIYHLKGSPVDPDRLYASQSTGWFGQMVQRSKDGDHVTKRRRAFVRFFACEQDFSLEEPNFRLPEAVVAGAEPLLIVGAIAGG